MIPGEYKLKKEDLECNQGKESITVKVTNTDDRPIAVGSHYHFFEVNKFMSFDREATFGYHLDIPPVQVSALRQKKQKQYNWSHLEETV